MEDEETTQASAPTQKLRVRLGYGMPGGRVVIAGKEYVVDENHQVTVPADLSDDDIKAANVVVKV
jgi:hypothetical protein